MGRRKNNPDLVEELIENRWITNPDKYVEKYNSLSRSDMKKVDEAIGSIEGEFMDDDSLDGCVACGNPAFPNCTGSCPIFDD